MIKLGERVRCSVTGFEGVATKRIEVLHGSSQLFVEGHDNGFRRDEWIEEGRLKAVEQKAVSPVASLPPVVRPPSPGTSL